MYHPLFVEIASYVKRGLYILAALFVLVAAVLVIRFGTGVVDLWSYVIIPVGLAIYLLAGAALCVLVALLLPERPSVYDWKQDAERALNTRFVRGFPAADQRRIRRNAEKEARFASAYVLRRVEGMGRVVDVGARFVRVALGKYWVERRRKGGQTPVGDQTRFIDITRSGMTKVEDLGTGYMVVDYSNNRIVEIEKVEPVTHDPQHLNCYWVTFKGEYRFQADADEWWRVVKRQQ